MREALCQGMGADCFIGSGFSGRQIWDFSLSVEDIFFYCKSLISTVKAFEYFSLFFFFINTHYFREYCFAFVGECDSSKGKYGVVGPRVGSSSSAT